MGWDAMQWKNRYWERKGRVHNLNRAVPPSLSLPRLQINLKLCVMYHVSCRGMLRCAAGSLVLQHIYFAACMRLLYPTKTPEPRKQRDGREGNWVAYTTIRSSILLARISRGDDKQLNRSYVHGARKCVWGNCRSKHLISSLHLEFFSFFYLIPSPALDISEL